MFVATHLFIVVVLAFSTFNVIDCGDAIGQKFLHHSFKSSVKQHQAHAVRVGPRTMKLAGVGCIYQPPANNSAGVWLLLHACQANAKDWFGATFDTDFGGFSEETAMANELLSRGYGLLAMQSASGGCWRNGEETTVAAALKEFPGGVPQKLYAVGASSGGVLLTMLVARHLATFQGIVLNVAPPVGAQDRSALSAFPPTAIVYMPDDPHFATSRGIFAVKDALVRSGRQVAVYAAYPKPISAEGICMRVKTLHVSSAVCAKLAQGLEKAHMLEERGGKMYFRKVGTVPGAFTSVVDYAMKQVLPQAGISLKQVRQMWQELKVMEGLHSVTAEHFGTAVDFVTGVNKPTTKTETNVVPCQHSKAGLPSDWLPQREICAPPDIATALTVRSPLSSFNSLSSFMCACLYVKVTACLTKVPHLVDFNGDIVNLTLPSTVNAGKVADATTVTTFLATAKHAICSLTGKPGQTGQQDCKACAAWDPHPQV